MIETNCKPFYMNLSGCPCRKVMTLKPTKFHAESCIKFTDAGVELEYETIEISHLMMMSEVEEDLSSQAFMLPYDCIT